MRLRGRNRSNMGAPMRGERAIGGSRLRSRRSEHRQHVPIPDRDAAARVAHAESAGIEVLRVGRADEDHREADGEVTL